MDLRVQPKPELEIEQADKAFVSRKQYFVKKTFEKIKQFSLSAHLIRHWRPKAESIYPPVLNEDSIEYECDFNREIQDCFVEDYAEEIFLKNPPPCFVIFGKLGGNVGKLCEEIASEFDSVVIKVDDVVNQVIGTNCETSKLLNKILREGLALTLNFILALLSYVAHSPEARHRGYVLCGLPASPYLHDLSVEEQLNYLFTWENKPTVFINVLDEEENLIRQRINSRFEIQKVGIETKYFLRFEKSYPSEGDVEEERLEKISSGKDEIDIDILPSRPWVILPLNEESQIWSDLESFDIKLKPAIDMLISRVDPQYVITVDCRLKNEFELIKARLNLLHIWKSPTATPFFPPKDNMTQLKNAANEEFEKEDELKEEEPGEGDNYDLMKVKNESPQKAFLTLFNKNIISPKHRWELSHYNYICPVSLREGLMTEGKSEFAVVFMKYIYFLRNKESMLKFLKNPRPYVLPVRPKPPARFFIVGYPYSGKTILAKLLAAEFSIPIINAVTLLQKDAEKKKFYYQDFCRQKAEKKEIIRLTVQAWKDWREEEDQRIDLIEQWMSYIQSLLRRRIEQFYTKEKKQSESSNTNETESSSTESTNKSIEISGEDNEFSSKSKKRESVAVPNKKLEDKALEVQGISMQLSESDPYEREHTPVDDHVTPSEKIIQAMKHEDYEFNENGLEVEANLFFSSLWSSFSGREEVDQLPKKIESKKESEEEFFYEDHSEEGERDYELSFKKSPKESSSVDWCSLLPPQSLSSLLLLKTPYKKREKNKSFKTLLAAASKAYWAPSALKKEFAKWHIPCYMDIRLCEIFLDNPLLLYRYCPQWLMERPEIPDPVDPIHPSIQEAGRKAFLMASVVTVTHNREEIVIILRNGIEKIEREGMRITGDVVTSRGWIMDDMILDQEIWSALAAEKIIPDYVIFLTDSDPDHRRIINSWYELHYPPESDEDFFYDLTSKESEEFESKDSHQFYSATADFYSKGTRYSRSKKEKKKEVKFESIIRKLLNECTDLINEGDQELDDVFNILVNGATGAPKLRALYSDPFTQNVLFGSKKVEENLKKESSEDNQMSVSPSIAGSNQSLFYRAKLSYSVHFLPLGTPLQVVTSKILDFFKDKNPSKGDQLRYKENFKQKLFFFVSLLTIPQKLENLKDWLKSIDRGDTIKEIDVKGKTEYEVFFDVRKDLFKHLIKKPRELENFEKEEIKRELKKKKINESDISEEDNEETPEESLGKISEDVCIFGESGQLCIVSLERNRLLRGKPDIALRYYGKLYFFWDLEAKNKFLEDPEKYAPYYSPIRCLPPMRIFLVGPIGSGKSTLAYSISNQCSIHFVDYIKLLNDTLIPHNIRQSEKLIPMQSQKLLLSENDNDMAKSLKRKFKGIPFEDRQYWLENPYKEDEEQLKIFGNINEAQLDSTPTNFPELVYRNIESVEEEKSDIKMASRTDMSVEAPPFLSMNEINASLDNYFNNKEALSDYCLSHSLNLIWSKPPFINQGFILDGYPIRFFDIEGIKQNKWFPDMVIEIILPESDMIDRNINDKLSAWETKLKQDIVEEKLIEDTLTFIYRNLMLKRRIELIEERKNSEVQFQKSHESSNVKSEEFFKNEDQQEPEKLMSSRSKKSKVSVGSSEFGNDRNFQNGKSDSMNTINAEVEEILKQEFPSLVFNPVFETYEAAKARITSELRDNYRKDMGEIEKIKNAFQRLNIPWVEIDNLQEISDIEREIFIRLNQIKKRTGSKGEFAFEVTMDMAQKLLKQGYYFLSKFGKWCPVQVHRMKNPIQMFIPLEKKGKIFPVIYRNYIYFIGGENEKNHFIDNPLKYTFNEPHHPNIPLRVAVIGPPKSGKSTLSHRLGLMFGLKVVTMGTALRFVLEKMHGTELQKSINNHLRRGCFLPLSLKTEALVACLNDQACVTQGFVFDGIPFDAAMTQSLAENGKLPFVILSLVADPDTAKANRRKLDVKQFRIAYKQKLNLNLSYKEWKKTYKRFGQWNHEAFSNLYEVKAKANAVEVFYEAYDIIRKAFFSILHYVEYCVTDRVLPLQYLCISIQEYELRKSQYFSYCPVCWAVLNVLTCVSDPPPRVGLVQYLNHFYWICSKHIQLFMQNPKNYFPPNAPQFTKFLPKLLNRKMFEASSSQLRINGLGRCPVSKVDFPDSFDWEGSWDFAVSYADKIYLCKNQKMLNRFLSRPWRYACADIVFELDRSKKSNAIQQLGPPKLKSLPAIGFLEQTVADLIKNALQVLGSIRPLYPNLTPTCTGCTFIGIFLKVYNKRNKISYLHADYLNLIETHCRVFRYKLPPFKRSQLEEALSELEPLSSESNETESIEGEVVGQVSSLRSTHKKSEFEESSWLDFESQADKKMWSAKFQSMKYTEMVMTQNNELHEILELPRFEVVLRYQTYSLRSQPLPPIPNCISYIYSIKHPLSVPKKFNIDSLYQTSTYFPSPFPPELTFNPEKGAPTLLFSQKRPRHVSECNLHRGKRVISDSFLEEPKEFVEKSETPDTDYMMQNYIPRFHVLDMTTPVNVPALPKVVETTPIIYNPHRDYTYTLLMSDFFHTSHVLRCFEWMECMHQLEFSSLLDRNLSLNNAPSQFFFKPRITDSMQTIKSKGSFIDSPFYVRDETVEPEFNFRSSIAEKDLSLLNFMEVLIMEKLDHLFYRLSLSEFSYDSFEIHITSTESNISMKPTIFYREILPYPPLIWDILSTPYYAYLSIPSIFGLPHLESIAHERHVSLLDGIMEPQDQFRFVRYPTWVQIKKESTPIHKTVKSDPLRKLKKEVVVPTHYFLYDFFSLPWTAFLTYPFSWAYNLDLRDNFLGLDENTDTVVHDDLSRETD